MVRDAAVTVSNEGDDYLLASCVCAVTERIIRMGVHLDLL